MKLKTELQNIQGMMIAALGDFRPGGMGEVQLKMAVSALGAVLGDDALDQETAERLGSALAPTPATAPSSSSSSTGLSPELAAILDNLQAGMSARQLEHEQTMRALDAVTYALDALLAGAQAPSSSSSTGTGGDLDAAAQARPG